jgi:hypothetical protein
MVVVEKGTGERWGKVPAEALAQLFRTGKADPKNTTQSEIEKVHAENLDKFGQYKDSIFRTHYMNIAAQLKVGAEANGARAAQAKSKEGDTDEGAKAERT